MQTVAAIYSDREKTDDVVQSLMDRGVESERIGTLWREKSVEVPETYETVEYRDHFESPGSEAAKGAAGGAIGGAATGAGTMLLASAGIVLLPGIGAFLAAGAAAAAAAAAGAGAVGGGVAGGAIGALLGATDKDATKVTEEHRRIRRALEEDGYVVTVDAEEGQVDDLVSFFDESDARDVTVLHGDPAEETAS